MRNLRVNHVTATQKVVTDLLQGCEKFAEDPCSGSVFVATPSKLMWLNEELEISSEFDWSMERTGTSLIDLVYMADNNEVVAILNNGLVITVNLDTSEISEVGILMDGVECASWSQDMETLSIVSGRTLSFYDRLFTPLIECDLYGDEQGKDELVTVGWGSKETQFQGSIGKAAREKKTVNRSAFPDDTHLSSLSWRADAQFVAVSYYDGPSGERRVAVYNREGDLMSRLKNEYGLEEGVSVRPTGNYIVTTRRNEEGTRTMCFFERNGEPRHEAPLFGEGVKRGQLQWDCEGAILGVQTERNGSHAVELWTVSNYDWTMKLRIPVKGGISHWSWSAETGGLLSILSSSGVFSRLQMAFEYNTNEGKAVVVATDCLRITNLSQFPIPPPMCEYSVTLRSACLLFVHNGDKLGVVYDDLTVETWKEEASRFTSVSHTTPSWKDTPLSLTGGVLIDGRMIMSGWIGDGNTVVEYGGEGGEIRHLYSSPEPIIWLGANPVDSSIVCILASGDVISVGEVPRILFQLGSMKTVQACFTGPSLLTLSPSHSLCINGSEVANGVSSFLSSQSTVLYISLQSRLHIIGLEDRKQLCKERAVELGSRLVGGACVGTTSVTMQMPRGNLETIHPRPFVIGVIKSLADSLQYLDALRMMKKHRIDMNLLIDHDPKTFLSNIAVLVDKCKDADLLNLFVSSLNEGKSEYVTDGEVVTDKVDTVCSLLESHILSLSVSRRLTLFTTLLSALLKKSPPKIHDALSYIKEHTKQMSVSDGEVFSRRCLHHVGFFVDDKALFSASLATYDLSLTLQVAEASNRDPKEYLPLLNRLNKIEPITYRRYHTDLVREDYEGALRHIAEMEEKFDEAVQLIKDHNLYPKAIIIYKGNTKYKDICHLYASHLESKAQWREASMLFARAGDSDKTLRCLEMSRDPAAYVTCARSIGRSDEEIQKTLQKIVLTLKTSERWEEVAEGLRLMNAPVVDICEALCKSGEWLKAVERAGEEERARSIVLTAVVDRGNVVLREIETRRTEMKRHCERLGVVREGKGKRIDNLKEGLESGRDLEDIDAFSEASTLSRVSKRSGSSRASTTATQRKRKQIDKKKQNLKEGGEYEDAAILLALHGVYGSINKLIAEMPSLLPALISLDEMSLASLLQSTLSSLETEAVHRVSSVWPNKLHPQHLVGPLHALYTVNNVFVFPEGGVGAMPSVIQWEPEMSPPKLDSETTWKLLMLM